MSPVNVLVSGLPTLPTLCLQVGDLSRPLFSHEVSSAIVAATGLPRTSFFIRLASGPLPSSAIVAPSGQHTAFIIASLRRALPGGKGGFGANLKASAASTTADFSACRDLQGNRLGELQNVQALNDLVEEGRREARQAQLVAQQNNNNVEHRNGKRKRTKDLDRNQDLENDHTHHLQDLMVDVAQQVGNAVKEGRKLARKVNPNQCATNVMRKDDNLDPIHGWFESYVSDGSTSDNSQCSEREGSL